MGGEIRKQTSLIRLRKCLGEGPRILPHSALSDDIAGEEVKLKNEYLMYCNYTANFTIFREQDKQNHKTIF